MIRHIVFFSARANEDVAAIKAGLEPLGQIPYSSIFEVSLNAKVDPLCDAVDIVVYAEFPGQAEACRRQGAPDLCRGDAEGEAAEGVALLGRCRLQRPLNERRVGQSGSDSDGIGKRHRTGNWEPASGKSDAQTKG